MTFTGVTNEQRSQLALEVVPQRVRTRLTRLLRASCAGELAIIHMNRAINIARTALGLPIYVLDGDGWGEYHPAQHAWHVGELELVMRRPDTAQLAEVLVDLVKASVLHPSEVNTVLGEENVSFRLREPNDLAMVRGVDVEVVPVDEIAPPDMNGEHPNIRALCQRMDAQVTAKDPAAVLHSAACVFEALAKDVVGTPGVQNKTLGAIFHKYQQESQLPTAISDYVLEVYQRRNREPLAGHGHLSPPTITHQEAVTLAELTKALVRIERQLATVELSAVEKASIRTSNPPQPQQPRPVNALRDDLQPMPSKKD